MFHVMTCFATAALWAVLCDSVQLPSNADGSEVSFAQANVLSEAVETKRKRKDTRKRKRHARSPLTQDDDSFDDDLEKRLAKLRPRNKKEEDLQDSFRTSRRSPCRPEPTPIPTPCPSPCKTRSPTPCPTPCPKPRPSPRSSKHKCKKFHIRLKLPKTKHAKVRPTPCPKPCKMPKTTTTTTTTRCQTTTTPPKKRKCRRTLCQKVNKCRELARRLRRAQGVSERTRRAKFRATARARSAEASADHLAEREELLGEQLRELSDHRVASKLNRVNKKALEGTTVTTSLSPNVAALQQQAKASLSRAREFLSAARIAKTRKHHDVEMAAKRGCVKAVKQATELMSRAQQQGAFGNGTNTSLAITPSTIGALQGMMFMPFMMGGGLNMTTKKHLHHISNFEEHLKNITKDDDMVNWMKSRMFDRVMQDLNRELDLSQKESEASNASMHEDEKLMLAKQAAYARLGKLRANEHKHILKVAGKQLKQMSCMIKKRLSRCHLRKVMLKAVKKAKQPCPAPSRRLKPASKKTSCNSCKRKKKTAGHGKRKACNSCKKLSKGKGGKKCNKCKKGKQSACKKTSQCKKKGKKKSPCKKGKKKSPCKKGKKKSPCKKGKKKSPCKKGKKKSPCKKGKQGACKKKSQCKKGKKGSCKKKSPCKKGKKKSPCKKGKQGACKKKSQCKKGKKGSCKKKSPCKNGKQGSCEKKSPCKTGKQGPYKKRSPCEKKKRGPPKKKRISLKMAAKILQKKGSGKR
eukprot:TRINITY_DN150_c0_g1_i6.p1 TRINITY_DN150_c0_g1~~TRINITY_DN150_c0_g1_i6.p1  ORF type:complete len:746 (-),score=158.66 TRINITY_DN150_c0_g1_i6:167-2404(-)